MLTAGHCVRPFDYDSDKIYVVLGTSDLNDSQKGQMIRVLNIIPFPDYSGSKSHDIALLELAEPVESQPIKLTSFPVEEMLGPAQIMGWGYTEKGSKRFKKDSNLPNNLRQVDISLVSEFECQRVFGEKVDETMICAGDLNGEKDACNLDSGGPLFVNYGGVHVQVGVISWGHGCAEEGYYGVYANIYPHLSFIRKHIYSDEEPFYPQIYFSTNIVGSSLKLNLKIQSNSNDRTYGALTLVMLDTPIGQRWFNLTNSVWQKDLYSNRRLFPYSGHFEFELLHSPVTFPGNYSVYGAVFKGAAGSPKSIEEIDWDSMVSFESLSFQIQSE